MAKTCFFNNTKNNDKMPILVGGSGFYLKSLIHGFYDIPQIDCAIKSKIARIKNQSLWNVFCKYELNTMDNKIHKNDYYRLKRAIEIKLQTGKNMSEFKIIKPYQIANYKIIHIMVLPDKTSTNNLIEKRFYKMIENGAMKRGRKK